MLSADDNPALKSPEKNEIDTTKVHPSKVEKAPEGVKSRVFKQNFRKSNICSRIFYTYGNPLINAVIANGWSMTEDMIEDMTKQEGETEMYTKKLMDAYEANLKKRKA